MTPDNGLIFNLQGIVVSCHVQIVPTLTLVTATDTITSLLDIINKYSKRPARIAICRNE